MTEKNKIENIRVAMEKASKTLSEAELLFNGGFIAGAVSRLYYFLLHSVRALLLTKGLEPKSHEGVLRVFSLHFVKEGIFDPKTSHILARLMKYREEADYNPSYIFTSEDFIEFKTEVEALTDKIKGYLMEKGYL